MDLWNSNIYGMGLIEARKLAKQIGVDFYFDWESCRTEEGYYLVEGSV